jgi:ABC-2 type transport system permease protein
VRRGRAVLEVARWEFVRYVKPRQQLLSLLITFTFLMGGSWVGRMAAGPSTVELAVIGAAELPTLPEEAGRFRFLPGDVGAEGALREAVVARELAGLLVLHGDDRGELFARQDPGWRGDLERELLAAGVVHRLQDTGLGLEDLAALEAPFQLEIREAAPRAGRGERIAAFVALGLVLLGLFSGIGYIFSSVTGEKQNRLSEQVVSAIPAQSWIDGKILGLSGVSMVAILNIVVAGVLFLGVSRLVWGSTVSLPTSVERPDLLVAALSIILLGYMFWFSFLTAIAALLEDPHTSARSQILFLPVLTMIPAFFAVPDPGATWVRVLGLVPPTSSAVMPARLLVTDVPWWEVALSAVVMVGAVMAVRRVAGKVFRLAMLMYGKEPAWSEVRRWLKEA